MILNTRLGGICKKCKAKKVCKMRERAEMEISLHGNSLPNGSRVKVFMCTRFMGKERQLTQYSVKCTVCANRLACKYLYSATVIERELDICAHNLGYTMLTGVFVKCRSFKLIDELKEKSKNGDI